MKDFDSLVGIWNEQKTAPVVNYKEIIVQYKASRNKLSYKLFYEVLAMLFALLMITYIAYTVEFDFWTTHLGLAVVISCCLYFIVMQVVNIKKIANSNTLFDKPQDHIKFIQQFRAARHTQHTRNYKIYTLSLTAGLALYFVEFFYKLSPWVMAVVVITTIAWFLAYYFYFLKQYVKKENQKFEEMISDLERLDAQFKDVE
ncbi:hypothetical protein [Pedobacter alpinus]|uniref:Uncharacterized protein n=1 Tax=Pedobacter alpinus TaxID=1590643 RepID=A0ABW5TWP0_9SPHI